MGVLVPKKMIDIDKTLVTLKFVLTNRDKIIIHTTVSQAIDFTDFLNNNKAVVINRPEYRDWFQYRYYTFDDYKKKETMTISLPDVMGFTVPFFCDEGKNYNMKTMILKV